jgi:signal transduction histidine kinase
MLITLPVIVLAAAGLVSLRQDRLLVEHEAADRAQELADNLVSSLWRSLTTSPATELPTFTIGSGGEVSFPPSLALTPHPQSMDGDELSSAQQGLWKTARRSAGESRERWAQFLAGNSPSNYQAAAHYALGLLLVEAGQREAAASNFLTVAGRFPGVVGETGLPLQPLAEFKLLALGANGTQTGIGLAEFCSNVVYRPTLLTPYLLNAAAELADAPADRQMCERWAKTWDNHEIGRRMAAAYQRESRTTATLPALLWVPPLTVEDSPAETSDRWLLIQTGEDNDLRHFVCQRESDLAQQIPATVSAGFRIPPHFAVKVTLAGREFPETPASGAQPPPPDAKTLALGTRLLGGAEALRVAVTLADRDALFQRQRLRTFWFGLLIAAAAMTALVGFVGTWRAYARQRRLNELKSDFVSSVSHELRAPIASVRLMAESLDRGKITESTKQRDYFRFISQECRRLSALIENVLDFARIEQGRKQYEFEAADLAALVRNTVTLMEPCAAEREVGLRLQLPQTVSDGLPLTVDAKALQQALVNLVDNAIKHSRPKSEVTLGLEPGDPLRLWVEDHGPGIPPGEHEKIFERFYRHGSELRRETQGVGIGLSIVKHIVEAHGGRVVVRSAVGKGSRFTIELPVHPPEKQP